MAISISMHRFCNDIYMERGAVLESIYIYIHVRFIHIHMHIHIDIYTYRHTYIQIYYFKYSTTCRYEYSSDCIDMYLCILYIRIQSRHKVYT